jgi:hypothetical protein
MIAVGSIVNHAVRSPYIARKLSPLSLAVPLVPTAVAEMTAPPHSPWFSRWVTTSRISRPTCGCERSIVAALTLADHVCTGLPEKLSYGSALATKYGALPVELQPPVEEENCVNAGRPP